MGCWQTLEELEGFYVPCVGVSRRTGLGKYTIRGNLNA